MIYQQYNYWMEFGKKATERFGEMRGVNSINGTGLGEYFHCRPAGAYRILAVIDEKEFVIHVEREEVPAPSVKRIRLLSIHRLDGTEVWAGKSELMSTDQELWDAIVNATKGL